MRIGVHLESLRPGEIGGLETYARNVLDELRRLDPSLTLVLLCASYNRQTFREGPGLELHLLSTEAFAAPDEGTFRSLALDLWFCPLLVLSPVLPSLPAVATIPDLQHETYPEFFPAEVLDWRRCHYARTAAEAQAILTFSSFSRNEILETLGVDGEKVVVTHLDASAEFDSQAPSEPADLERIRARHRLPQTYLYYPANFWPHKNHRLLFRALALFRQRHGWVPTLVLSGGSVPGSEDWRSAAEKLSLEDEIHYLGHVPEKDLPLLYECATAMVFPSLFEGFGIPVVEALRSDCPVLCSHATSLPEIAEDAALYFDPQDPEDLCDRLGDLLLGLPGEDPTALRERLVAAGRRRREAFSWARTAGQTLAVFRRLIDEARSPAVLSPTSPRPRLSIVMPSYQQGQFIERSLASIFRQEYPDLQVLVMDGGSTDATVEILERYKKLYPQVMDYVSEPDLGQAHAPSTKGSIARRERSSAGSTRTIPTNLGALTQSRTSSQLRPAMLSTVGHTISARRTCRSATIRPGPSSTGGSSPTSASSVSRRYSGRDRSSRPDTAWMSRSRRAWTTTSGSASERASRCASSTAISRTRASTS